MDAKKKAVELVQKFGSITYQNIKGDNIDGNSIDYIAKQCTLITVDTVMNELAGVGVIANIDLEWNINYWKQVKTEIEKL